LLFGNVKANKAKIVGYVTFILPFVLQIKRKRPKAFWKREINVS
jgi:hypothetical protein